MSLITGLVVTAVTFPGVILRHIISQLLCSYFRIPVFKICYFNPLTPRGTVQFETPSSPWTTLSLVFGPLCFTTLLGFLTGAPAVLDLLAGGPYPVVALIDLFLIWLGVSFAVHSFPTIEHAKVLENTLLTSRHALPIRVMGQMAVSFSYIAAVSAFLWIDVIYALAVVVGIPILAFLVIQMAYR